MKGPPRRVNVRIKAQVVSRTGYSIKSKKKGNRSRLRISKAKTQKPFAFNLNLSTLALVSNNPKEIKRLVKETYQRFKEVMDRYQSKKGVASVKVKGLIFDAVTDVKPLKKKKKYQDREGKR